MKSIKIVGNGFYLPEQEVENSILEKEFNLEDGYIIKRTGIEKRYYKNKEDICEIAYKSALDALKNSKIEKDSIELIIVATTSTNTLMPGISYYIQKMLDIKKCICLDILAGCAGYVNAFDIAKMYMDLEKAKYAMVIGVDVLSDCTDNKDINTKIILSDGAGCTILGKDEKKKLYLTNIQSDGKGGDILTYKINEKIYMNGKAVYKYAVTDTVKNIEELLNQANLKIEDVKYIIPHQSNTKIMKSIASKLNIPTEKMYININKVGNTFCASIPIALTQMYEEKLLNDGDKVILIGYGGGLNTASILFEV